MTAIEFLRRYRPGSLVKSSARGEYQLAEHDSFKINGESSVWHWKSRDIGGKSALKYLIYVEGVPFVEAVQLLCEESPMYIPVQHEAVERERPQFKLPRKAPTNDRVTRYLRGAASHCPPSGTVLREKFYTKVQNITTVFSWAKTRRVCRNMLLCAVFMTTGNHSSAKHRAVRNSTDSASRRCSPALPWRCLKPP